MNIPKKAQSKLTAAEVIADVYIAGGNQQGNHSAHKRPAQIQFGCATCSQTK